MKRTLTTIVYVDHHEYDPVLLHDYGRSSDKVFTLSAVVAAAGLNSFLPPVACLRAVIAAVVAANENRRCFTLVFPFELLRPSSPTSSCGPRAIRACRLSGRFGLSLPLPSTFPISLFLALHTSTSFMLRETDAERTGELSAPALSEISLSCHTSVSARRLFWVAEGFALNGDLPTSSSFGNSKGLVVTPRAGSSSCLTLAGLTSPVTQNRVVDTRTRADVLFRFGLVLPARRGEHSRDATVIASLSKLALSSCSACERVYKAAEEATCEFTAIVGHVDAVADAVADAHAEDEEDDEDDDDNVELPPAAQTLSLALFALKNPVAVDAQVPGLLSVRGRLLLTVRLSDGSTVVA